MQRVAGYLADDGTFFVSKFEAMRHDALVAMQKWCESHDVDANRLIPIIEALADPIVEFVNASNEIKLAAQHENQAGLAQSYSHNAGDTDIGEYPANDGEAESESQTILEQPSRGREPMPNVGSSA
jgi:hypothetical protein